MQLLISEIIIKPDRIRKTFSDKYIEQLSESFRAVGQIHPILVDEKNTLVAGECRIRAARLLGWTSIRAEQESNLEPWQKDVIELEENLRREDLSYAEEVLAVDRLHELHQDKFGKAKAGPGKQGWNVRATADLLGISSGAVSQDIQLAKAIKQDPELAKQKSKIAAKSMLGRKQAIKTRQLLAILSKAKEPKEAGQSTPTPAKTPPLAFMHGDSRLLISSLPDNSISCLLTDPPWEVEFDEEFGSDKTTGLDITKEVLTLLYPKLQDGALCWMFCATKHLIKGTIYDLVQECGYRTFDQVLLWYKPTVAHSSHPYRELKNDYEPCFVFSKGQARDFIHPIFAVQEEKILGTKLHPAQKPQGVLKLIIEVSTVENETVIDPFMGGGSVLQAARDVGRKAIGMEKQEEWFNLASSI